MVENGWVRPVNTLLWSLNLAPSGGVSVKGESTQKLLQRKPPDAQVTPGARVPVPQPAGSEEHREDFLSRHVASRRGESYEVS